MLWTLFIVVNDRYDRIPIHYRLNISEHLIVTW